VCASHRKLRDEADAGRFRHDLYYRINGLTVVLPPLRERDDFAVLTQRMLADFNPGREVQVEPALMARLQAYHWPGNLRQYANTPMCCAQPAPCWTTMKTTSLGRICRMMCRRIWRCHCPSRQALHQNHPTICRSWAAPPFAKR
jgi:transcriptional regulator with GAF, ATPase, and Fis domain